MAKKPTKTAASEAAQTGEFSVEMWPIDRPKPYDRNPRVLTPAAVEKVAMSLKTYGWRQPITVDPEGVIVTGHTRLQAARSLGMTQVPVHVIRNLPDAAIRAYRIADNRVAEETDWDKALLSVELGDLTELNFDLASLGFDEKELDSLISGILGDDGDEGGGSQHPDAGTNLAKLGHITIADPKTQVEPGKVYQLGRHVLICACPLTEWAQWKDLLKDESDVFAPYPGIFLPFAERASDRRLVMVQPDAYIAGHIIDKWNAVYPKNKAKAAA